MVEIHDLHVRFHGASREAVAGIDLTIRDGEVVGLVGESGSGKTVTAMTLSGLIERKKVTLSGEVRFDGRDILRLPRAELRAIQGRELGVVFQEPMTAMDPLMRIGPQVEEALAVHTQLTKEQRRARALEALRDVDLPAPEEIYRKYPHECSGGQLQRVMIAAAIVTDPHLLLLDEPTTALDVTVQAQILDLLREMQDRVGASIIMITHDLGVVAEVSDKIAVMYAGRKVEEGSVEQILFNPQHPYTKALKGCIPHLQRTPTSGRHRLHEIPGMVLGMAELGKDRCSFYERCPCGKPECMEHNPPAKAIDAGHEVACWLYS